MDLDNGTIGTLYYKLFKPSRPIPQDVTKIHRITNDDVKNLPSIEGELPYLLHLMEGSGLVIGQNVRFDMDMLELEFKRYNSPIPRWPKALDLVENSIYLKGFRLSLTNLHVELFGKEFEGAHKADTDVNITCLCAIEMYKRGLL